MQADEMDRLETLFEALRGVQATAGDVEEGPTDKGGKQVVLNVVVAVVVNMNDETYQKFASSVQAQARARSETFLANLLTEVGELAERLLASHRAAQIALGTEGGGA